MASCGLWRAAHEQRSPSLMKHSRSQFSALLQRYQFEKQRSRNSHALLIAALMVLVSHGYKAGRDWRDKLYLMNYTFLLTREYRIFFNWCHTRCPCFKIVIASSSFIIWKWNGGCPKGLWLSDLRTSNGERKRARWDVRKIGRWRSFSFRTRLAALDFSLAHFFLFCLRSKRSQASEELLSYSGHANTIRALLSLKRLLPGACVSVSVVLGSNPQALWVEKINRVLKS